MTMAPMAIHVIDIPSKDERISGGGACGTVELDVEDILVLFVIESLEFDIVSEEELKIEELELV